MISVREDIGVDERNGVRVFLPASGMNDSDSKEFEANDRFERSLLAKSAGRAVFDEILAKADFIRTFAHVKGTIDVRPGDSVLELGASHGWASVLIKDDCPDAHVVTSDMVPDCVAHCGDYEQVIGRTVDEKWAFSARDMPFKDAQFDRIFTFAAFHHFGDRGDYRRTLAEISRVLKPGGRLVLLYEPSTPALFYPLAYRRVNRKRAEEGVDEDVLVTRRLRSVATECGLSVDAMPFAFYRYRSSPLVGAYYLAVAKLGLARFATCTANIVFEKGERVMPSACRGNDAEVARGGQGTLAVHAEVK